MIIIKLQGGLGNQMFQYACAKALALKHNQKLFIDNSFLEENQVETNQFTPRGYELDIFHLRTEIAAKQLVKSFEANSFYQKLRRIFKLSYKKCYDETPDRGAEQLDKLSFPVFLKGYWQSEQFFSDYKDKIRKAFTFSASTTTEVSDILAQIHHTNAVSIHFRRGDYMTNPVAKAVLGVLDISYYNDAIKEIQHKVDDPYFFIFSDDKEWVKKNLPLKHKFKIVEDFHLDNSYYDMLLMSRCKHHIIANSSFSWWAAWLNNNPDKLVIAPQRWFADERQNGAANNLLPADWIRL